jgi:hypothetical protein
MPYLKGSCFQVLLAHHNVGTGVPALSVDLTNGQWSYFGQANLPGQVTGYSMVAQGAFKSIAVSSELEAWLLSANVTTRDVHDRLAAVVNACMRRRLQRDLETVDDTGNNEVVAASPDGPVEVLYLDGLNTAAVAPVPSILAQTAAPALQGA